MTISTTSEAELLERPVPAWSEVLALVAAMVFPTIATWLYFVALAGHEAMQEAYSATKIVQFAFPLVWVWAICGRRPRWAWPRWSNVAVGLAVGGMILVAMLAAYFAFFAGGAYAADFRDDLRQKLSDFGTTTPLTFIALAAFYSLIHSGMEEYYWRWFVFGRLKRVVPVAVAIGLSSLAFMAHHVLVVSVYIDDWPARVLLSGAVAIGGVIWAWMYHGTGSLAGPWVSHMLVDAGIMVVGYHLAFGG